MDCRRGFSLCKSLEICFVANPGSTNRMKEPLVVSPTTNSCLCMIVSLRGPRYVNQQGVGRRWKLSAKAAFVRKVLSKMNGKPVLPDDSKSSNPVSRTTNQNCPSRPCCPVCGGGLIEIRAKLQCSKCHTICETCCEGGRG
jgi:hypothetical protein